MKCTTINSLDKQLQSMLVIRFSVGSPSKPVAKWKVLDQDRRDGRNPRPDGDEHWEVVRWWWLQERSSACFTCRVRTPQSRDHREPSFWFCGYGPRSNKSRTKIRSPASQRFDAMCFPCLKTCVIICETAILKICVTVIKFWGIQ